MHRNGFLLYCQAMSVVALLCSIAGCISDPAGGTTVQEVPELAVSKQEQGTITITDDDTIDGQAADDQLSGTCPKGDHCGSPSCPLWTDLNSNGLCDRGE